MCFILNVRERIEALRGRMRAEGIDAYLVPTDDFHGSEYVGDHFKCREYLTGFTGSAGTVVVTEKLAGLWTDARYFIQAADQIAGNGVTLFKMGEPDVPTVEEFLEQNLKAGMCLGFDGRTVDCAQEQKLRELLEKKGVSFAEERDLVGEVWPDRPPLPCRPVWELSVEWAGESRLSKCKRIREEMEKQGADAFVLSSLDDIAWLLNLRGDDIHCCPVFLSYLVMTKEEILLFAAGSAFSEEIKEALAADGVFLRPYEGIYARLSDFRKGDRVLLRRKKVNSRLVNAIPQGVIILDQPNLTYLPKAAKNPTEVQNERIAHIRDGVALTKFIFWLKKNLGKQTITELSAAEKLYGFRKEQEHFLGISFDTIASYGAHAAMNHYSPTPKTDIPVEQGGFLLVDSGGHYLEGTTDVTRTIVTGPLTEEQKLYFTAVLRGMLNLGDAKFRHGCTGRSLDYLTREPLWRMGRDFNHGTGHGVGYLLNVHEGPNSIRWRSRNGQAGAVLEEGMITSDEPGYYVEGAYGIRHENLLLCKKAEKTEFGQFMCFEHLTMAPFDLEGVIPEQMTRRERDLLNDYHRQVREKIGPYLTIEEREWLADATREI